VEETRNARPSVVEFPKTTPRNEDRGALCGGWVGKPGAVSAYFPHSLAVCPAGQILAMKRNADEDLFSGVVVLSGEERLKVDKWFGLACGKCG